MEHFAILVPEFDYSATFESSTSPWIGSLNILIPYCLVSLLFHGFRQSLEKEPVRSPGVEAIMSQSVMATTSFLRSIDKSYIQYLQQWRSRIFHLPFDWHSNVKETIPWGIIFVCCEYKHSAAVRWSLNWWSDRVQPQRCGFIWEESSGPLSPGRWSGCRCQIKLCIGFYIVSNES